VANKYKVQAREAQEAYRKHRTCDRKVKYKTRLQAQWEWAGGVYLCPYCTFWHRTSQIQ